MCGLAGYARHTKGKDHELVHLVGLDLLLAMQARGTHATGIGVFGKQEAFIVKSAVPAAQALESQPWKDALAKVNGGTMIMLGHTRHSTHPSNTKLDEAAHPFHIGNVVGAHNGMISNWREVWNGIGNKNEKPWIVDSQAAIGALDAISDPVKALDQLDGYWALSWVKKDELYFARTPGAGAPISCAYVPELLTLFWCSTSAPLVAILNKAGIKEYDLFELAERKVYRADPRRFDERGHHMKSEHAPFKGLRGAPTQRQIAATNGKTAWKRKGDRTEISGFTAAELVALVKKHDEFLHYIAKSMKEMADELDMLKKIAGVEEDADDEGQLDLGVGQRIIIPS